MFERMNVNDIENLNLEKLTFHKSDGVYSIRYDGIEIQLIAEQLLESMGADGFGACFEGIFNILIGELPANKMLEFKRNDKNRVELVI